MGSHLLSGFARTGRYRHLIALLGDSAGGGGAAGTEPGTLEEVADATLDASLAGLDLARGDMGLAYSVYLLVRLTRAAREQDFLLALEREGVPTPAVISGLPDVPVITEPERYAVYDLTSGFAAAVDRYLRGSQGRTDIGELAQLSAAESLSATCGRRGRRLFGDDANTVRSALRAMSTEAGFGRLTHDFFSRLVRRYLEYHLSRELSNHVGRGRRFADVDAHNEFLLRLDRHCRVCASIVTGFAGTWYSKHVYLDDVTVLKARNFSAQALDLVRQAFVYQEGGRD